MCSFFFLWRSIKIREIDRGVRERVRERDVIIKVDKVDYSGRARRTDKEASEKVSKAKERETES